MVVIYIDSFCGYQPRRLITKSPYQYGSISCGAEYHDERDSHFGSRGPRRLKPWDNGWDTRGVGERCSSKEGTASWLTWTWCQTLLGGVCQPNNESTHNDWKREVLGMTMGLPQCHTKLIRNCGNVGTCNFWMFLRHSLIWGDVQEIKKSGHLLFCVARHKRQHVCKF